MGYSVSHRFVPFFVNLMVTVKEEKEPYSSPWHKIRAARLYVSRSCMQRLSLGFAIVILLDGMTFLIGLLITLSKGYDHAEVIMVSNKDILIAAFLNALFCIGAGVVGSIAYWRSYRHRHIMMVVYTFLLWLCLAMITTIGYLAYNNTALNLKTKLGMKWRYDLTAEQHMVLQTNLRCCGFENPADHATYSAHCWPESLLPGCQNRLYNFQYNFLVKTYTMCFALLPVHVLATLSALYVFHDSKVEEPSYPPDMTDEDPTKVDTPAINFEHPACPACKNWTF